MKRPALLWFVLGNAFVSLFVFRGALWGNSLLAPLDIPAISFSKYHFVDPANSGILQNQWLADQAYYDLPLQYTIYHAYRRGEVPWWDPYTFAGRPLLADAHINGTDPVRLVCYASLPFLLAYNWTRILHFFLGGLGVFLLLRYFQVSPFVAIFFGLASEFAGYYTWFFGHPWIQACFIYYPFLWIVWDKAAREPAWWTGPAGAALVAAIFYAGNIQSHAYLVLFAVAFAIGQGGTDRAAWRALAGPMAWSLFLGGCLAAPVLSGQLEFFLVGVRSVHPAVNSRAWLSGLAALTAVYPWMLGSFRTVDLRNALWTSGSGLEHGVGFLLFIGSAGVVLAFTALLVKPTASLPPRHQRIGLALWATAGLVLSSPLIGIFYPRVAALGGLGMVVLAALACERLIRDATAYPRTGWIIGISSLVLALAINAAAFFVYPRFVPRLQAMLQARDASSPVYADVAPEVRNFQLKNLPNDITWKNPAALAASIALLLLGAVFASPRGREKYHLTEWMLGANLCSVLFFAHEFIPHQPATLWTRLLAGGPEQKKVAAALNPQALRLWERAPGRYEFLFPKAFGHFYQVHTVHGYSALFPSSFEMMSDAEKMKCREQVADYIYESRERGLAAGSLEKNAIPGLARFQWEEKIERQFTAEEKGLRTIALTFAPGPEATLLWTDTFYPGWTARFGTDRLRIERATPCFSKIRIPSGGGQLLLHFRPRFLRVSLLAALGACGVLLLRAFLKTR